MPDSPRSDFIETGKLPVIDPQNDPLWQKIDAFDLDDPDADLSFTTRLARENGWKPDYARRGGSGLAFASDLQQKLLG